MKNFSFFKKLRNERHAHYAQEFWDGMASGLYDTKKAVLKTLINAEKANLSNCRKNHYRVIWNNKINHLRAVMSALGHVLTKEAELGNVGADIEKHSYDTKVSKVTNNHDYMEAVHSFLYAWSGTESTGADALVDEARDIMKELENIVSFMEAEDQIIANIPIQESLRKPTDDYIQNIIRRAETEHFELNPDLEEEEGRWEEIHQFLMFVKAWIRRVTISVKNSKDDEKPEPENPSMIVELRKVNILPVSDDDEDMEFEEIDDVEVTSYDKGLTENSDAFADGYYEVYP